MPPSRAAVLDLLQYPCDEVGECDRCHDHGPLWLDTETEGAGEFCYCRQCWLRMAKPKDSLVTIELVHKGTVKETRRLPAEIAERVLKEPSAEDWEWRRSD